MGMGLGTSSALATALGRHQSGVESFMSFTTSYKDTGLTGLYFTAEPEALGHLAEKVCEVWRNLCRFEDEENLDRAMRSLLTSSLLMLDGTTPICEDIGRQLQRRMTTAELEEKIDSINIDTMRTIARNYFVQRPFAYTIIGRTKNWPSAEKLQKWLQ